MLRRWASNLPLRQEALGLYAMQALTLIAGLGVNVVIARVLGPAGKGSVDLFLALGTLLAEIGLLGIGSGLLYLLANKREPLAIVHGTGLVLVAGVGAAITALGGLALPLWRQVFTGLPDWALLLAFALAPAGLYRLAWLNLMIGLGQVRTSLRLNLAMTLGTLAGCVTLAAAGLLTAGTAILLLAATALLHGLTALGTTLRQEPAVAFSRALARQCLAFGGIVFLGQMANALHFKIDQMVIHQWLGPAALGRYAVAVRWAETLLILDYVLTSASVRAVCEGDPSDGWALTRRLSLMQFAISGAAGALLAVLAGPIVRFGYGPAFAEAALPMTVLVPGLVAWSVSKFSSQTLLFRMGERYYVVAAAIAGMIANLGLLWLFVRRLDWGLTGAALASSCSYGLVALAIIIRAARTARRAGPTSLGA